MDVDRMLTKCRRDQWSVDDLDFSEPPRPMRRDEEEAIVQYFHNMAAIERLAKALFAEQARRARDARLREIYETFVVDEERHAQVAERLAAHYDVHHYRRYTESPELERFRPYFLEAIRLLSDEVANAYITAGELILDVALLRSIDDYVADETSHRAMELINRDESRHIAVDYHMIEYYTRDEYWAEKARAPKPSLRERLKAAWATVNLLRTGGAFFTAVFFVPMKRTDPRGKRMLEAFKRMQLLHNMPGVERSPLAQFTQFLSDTYNHPLWGKLFGPLARRLTGFPAELLRNLFTDEEVERARKRGFDWLAEEALSAKYAVA